MYHKNVRKYQGLHEFKVTDTKINVMEINLYITLRNR